MQYYFYGSFMNDMRKKSFDLQKRADMLIKIVSYMFLGHVIRLHAPIYNDQYDELYFRANLYQSSKLFFLLNIAFSFVLKTVTVRLHCSVKRALFNKLEILMTNYIIQITL